MLVKYFKHFCVKHKNWWLLPALPVWVYGVFMVMQLLVPLAVAGLTKLGIFDFQSVNVVAANTIISVMVYVMSLAVVTGVPYWIAKRHTSLKLLGINDWPTIVEVMIAPLAIIVYMILSGILLLIATNLLAVNIQQRQALPFSETMLATNGQYILAFVTLVVLAPVVEELLFRGYLYGKLRNSFTIWVSVLVTSLAFGVAHLWGGPGNPLQWAVAIDTFALSIVMTVAREYTGAIWVPVLMHMIKNGLAFYLLFINPNIVHQLNEAVLPLLGGV